MSRNRVRIIGGVWRSRLIAFSPQRDLRPTPDRVRETLFNWLGQDLTGAVCLDLFAGSGALGFEAASRGARRVVMVDRDPVILGSLAAARDALGGDAVDIVRADALEYLRGDSSLYDVIFLDPPFAYEYWPQLAPLLPARLAPQGMVYHESARYPEVAPEWDVRRRGKAGKSCYLLLRRNQS